MLNGYGFWNKLGIKIAIKLNFKNWYRKHMRNPFGIHKEKVKRLAKIVRRTNAKVVMSSSWRSHWWNTSYEKMLGDERELTDLLNKYNIEVIDITPRFKDGRRDKEILSWLSEHKDEVENFVILDDERSDLECFVDRKLVQTSSVSKGKIIKGHWSENTGLKRRHIKRAIKILNSGERIYD